MARCLASTFVNLVTRESPRGLSLMCSSRHAPQFLCGVCRKLHLFYALSRTFSNNHNQLNRFIFPLLLPSAFLYFSMPSSTIHNPTIHKMSRSLQVLDSS